MGQKTVETSTYVSVLVASRIATKLILEVRFIWRLLGVDLDGSTLMLGDDIIIFFNTLFLQSVFQKKHNVISYHRLREAIAAKIVSFEKSQE
jgi:hypothetical protein